MSGHSPVDIIRFRVRTVRTLRTRPGMPLKIRHLEAGYPVRTAGAQARTARTEWPVRTVRSAPEPPRTAVAHKKLKGSKDLSERFAPFAVFAQQNRYGRCGGGSCLG